MLESFESNFGQKEKFTLPTNLEEMRVSLSTLALELERDQIAVLPDEGKRIKRIQDLSAHLEQLSEENKKLFVNPQGESGYYEVEEEIKRLHNLIKTREAEHGL